MKKCEPDTLLNQITMCLTIESQHLKSENRSHVQCLQQGQGPGSEYINFTHDGPIQKETIPTVSCAQTVSIPINGLMTLTTATGREEAWQDKD